MLALFVILLLGLTAALCLSKKARERDALSRISELQHRMDSLTGLLNQARFRIDSLKSNIAVSLETARKIDREVSRLGTEYKQRRVISRATLDSLASHAERNQKALESLQKELQALQP